MGDCIMRKTIKFNVIYPTDEEGINNVRANIKHFCNDILVTYINNLNCSYADKLYILEKISMSHKGEQGAQAEQ